VTVTLYSSGGQVVSTTVTNATGYYSFTNLVPGSYMVHFVRPALWNFVIALQGQDRGMDSDTNESGFTRYVTLAPGEYNDTIDAGIIRVTCVPLPGQEECG